VFANKVFRRLLGTKKFRMLSHITWSSHGIFRTVESSRLLWAGHAAGLGKTRDAQRNLERKSFVKRSLGRPRARCEYNIVIDVREMDCEDVRWMELAQDRVD
jgi:hypothetical protein